MNNAGISIIIPVYNESAGIGELLASIAPLKGECEIIFVDGGSNDDTVKKIEQAGYTIVRSPQKGRANQMNYGVSLASGEVLWFLHADSIPPTDALVQIGQVLNKGFSIGCFPIRFDSKHPYMFIHSFLSNNVRARLLGIAFGDQGIFLKRSLFEKLGGYAAIPLMEDYKLSQDARAAGYRIGIAKGNIITSERRYLTHGRLKTMWRMQMLQRKFRHGGDIEEIAAAYDAEKRRK